MKNYTKTNIGNEGRVELHEKLSLTGAEISLNRLAQAFPLFIRIKIMKRFTESFRAGEALLSTVKRLNLLPATGLKLRPRQNGSFRQQAILRCLLSAFR